MGQGIRWDGCCGDGLAAGYVHLFHHTQQGAWGVFGGLLSAYGFYGVLGVEGTFAVTPSTVLSGQASYNITDGAQTNFGHVRGEVWHYFNPNAKLGPPPTPTGRASIRIPHGRLVSQARSASCQRQ